MIESTAFKMALRIKTIVPHHPASVAVMKFSIALILNATFIIVLSLLMSLLTGKTSEVLIVLVGFALLRQLTGGLHLKTGVSCILVSTLFATIISFLELSIAQTHTITLISLIMILIKAPSGIEKQTRIPKKYYPLLKVLGAITVITNLFMHSDVLAIAFFLQGITLFIGRR